MTRHKSSSALFSGMPLLSASFASFASIVLAACSDSSARAPSDSTSEVVSALGATSATWPDPERVEVCWANGYDAETDLFPDERAAIRNSLDSAFAPLNGVFVHFVGFARCAPETAVDLRLILATREPARREATVSVTGGGRAAVVDVDRCGAGVAPALCASLAAVEEVAFVAGGGEHGCRAGALSPSAVARIHGLYLPTSEVLAQAFPGAALAGDPVLLGAGSVPWLDTGDWESMKVARGASVNLMQVGSSAENCEGTVRVSSSTHVTGVAPSLARDFDGVAEVNQAVGIFALGEGRGPTLELPVGSYFEGSAEIAALRSARVAALRVPAGLAIELCDNPDGRVCRTYTEDLASLPAEEQRPRYAQVSPTVVAYEEPYFRGRRATLRPRAFSGRNPVTVPFSEIRSLRVGAGLRVQVLDSRGAVLREIDDTLGGTPHLADDLRSQIAGLDVGYRPPLGLQVDPALVGLYSDPGANPASCGGGAEAIVTLRSGICAVRVDAAQGYWRGRPLVEDATLAERNAFCRFNWSSPSGAPADLTTLGARLDATVTVPSCARPGSGTGLNPVAEVAVAQVVPAPVSQDAVAQAPSAAHDPSAPLSCNFSCNKGPGRDACPACSRASAMILDGDVYVALDNVRNGTVTIEAPAAQAAVTAQVGGAQTFIVRNAFPAVVRGVAVVE